MTPKDLAKRMERGERFELADSSMQASSGNKVVMPAFGSPVAANEVLLRRTKYEHRDDKYRTRKVLKVWERREKRVDGIFLGTRVLQNGERDYDNECGYTFSATERFKVALISPGPNLNPVYVPLDALQA